MKGNLAQEVLKEIPEQVCLYMEQTGFRPAPKMVDMSQFDNPVLNAPSGQAPVPLQ
jgi:hypothetical protein